MRYFKLSVTFWVCCVCVDMRVHAACPDRDNLFVRGQVVTLPSDNPFEGAKAHVLCVGDYDADGILDASVINRLSPQLCILIGNGDGTFKNPVAYKLPTRGDSLYEGMCQGDLDGDGDIDLVGVDFFGSQLAVTFNDGLGVFGKPVMYSTGAGTWPHGGHARDIDGDGDLDLVVTYDYFQGNDSGAVGIWKNDGHGVFALWRVEMTGGKRPQNVGIGDFDGDGDLDYAAANSEWVGPGSTPSVTVFRNSGDGTMTQVQKVLTPTTSAPCSAEVADLDKDGALDLVVGSWTDESLCVLWGNGKGQFSAAQVLVGPPTSTAVEPAIADLDGDGALDIIVSLFEPAATVPTTKYAVMVFWGDGHRGFTAAPLLFTQGVNPRFPVAADFDRDGDLDIASIQWYSGTFEVFKNLCSAVAPTLFKRGDPNSDGKPDISDAVTILAYLFAQKPAPTCLAGGDINDDGALNIADAVALLGYLFAGTAAPPAPFTACGTDASDDTLTCVSFPRCQ